MRRAAVWSGTKQELSAKGASRLPGPPINASRFSLSLEPSTFLIVLRIELHSALNELL
jgi:hypothetical protein